MCVTDTSLFANRVWLYTTIFGLLVIIEISGCDDHCVNVLAHCQCFLLSIRNQWCPTPTWITGDSVDQCFMSAVKVASFGSGRCHIANLIGPKSHVSIAMRGAT